MSKIKYEALNSANVKVNNSGDLERVYSIEANANVNNLNEVSNIDNGIVKKGDEQKATFNVWGDNSLNISFYNATSDEQCAVINAVNAFIKDVKSHVADTPFVTAL